MRVEHWHCICDDVSTGAICSTGRNFVEAVRLYTQAIELNPLDATYWCNRAAARTKLEEYGFALLDACKLLDISSKAFLHLTRLQQRPSKSIQNMPRLFIGM